MRGSSPRQKEQKGSSESSARASVSSELPPPCTDFGSSYTKSTSQSAHRVNPCRYSALHCGQYIACQALSSPRLCVSRLSKTTFYPGLRDFQLFLDYFLFFGKLDSV